MNSGHKNNNKNHYFLILISFFIIGFYLNDGIIAQVKYNVSGNVYLEDQIGIGSHEGVKIKFYNLPGMVPEDSTYSQADGSYSIAISPGFYLVEWTKNGYVPFELGGLALAGDSTLSDVTLIPGQVSKVSGNVSGNWTKNYVYFVMGDLTVPAGQTLTIGEGVKVKFSAGTGMTCYGKLIINGTENEHVVFTSREPTPKPGDWKNLNLYSPNNKISYLDYEWATNGIVGDGVTGTEINHLNIDGHLSLTANGIFFENATNLKFTNCTIIASGEYGIYAMNPTNSIATNNTIKGPFSQAAIRLENADNSRIDSNKISGSPNRGIWARYSDNTSISHNTIVPNQNGIEAQEGSFLTMNYNKITDFHEHGIYFNSSENSVIERNRIISATNNGDRKWGINNDSNSQYAKIQFNYINIQSWNQDNLQGIIVHDSDIKYDTVVYRTSYQYRCNAIYANRSKIIGNLIYMEIDNTWDTDSKESESAIKSYGSQSSRSLIDSNLIQLNLRGSGIRASYADIANNTIIAGTNYYNSSWAFYLWDNCTIENNKIEGIGNGLKLWNQDSTKIINNEIIVNSYGIWANNSKFDLKNNLIKTNNNRGIHVYNKSGGNYSNNTIVSSTGDYGVYIYDYSDPVVSNNIIQGFNKGIYDDNNIQNFGLKYNDFWDIKSGKFFKGTALPPLVGQLIDQNANGDPADIYNNINLEPQFVYPDSNNYHLKITSKLINAGDPDIKDPDSTISDIGAFPYYQSVVIEHTPLKSTKDIVGPYKVKARIFSPPGNSVSGTLFYSTDNKNFTSVSMTHTANDSFYANIPGQPLNTTIYYYIQATDGTVTITKPFDSDKNKYTFFITLFSQFANLNGSSQTDGKILLRWNKPIPISGTLTGYKLYRSTTSGFTINSSTLYKELSADTMSYTDKNTEEAVTYYYKLTGIIDDGGNPIESLVSSEISVTSDNATVVRIKGYALLQGQTDHSGIKVYFEKVSPAAIADSMITPASGEINKVMHVGIYNIHLTKTGYQPIMLGNRFLSSNLNLDTLILKPGGTKILKGEISGTLLSSNIHFVDGDVLVPSGDTLIIQPGTQIKFRGKYQFEVQGTLLAEGTENEHIVFTSGMPAPLEGDWKRIYLNNAPNSKIIYCEFYYPENGILLNNSDYTEISYCTFDRHLLGARAISDNDYNNSDHLTITHNQILLSFTDAISLNNANNSEFSYNVIKSSGNGIWARDAHDSKFIGNKIQCQSWGIYAYNSDNSEFIDNYIYPEGNTYLTGGIHGEYSDNNLYRNNKVYGFRDHGIYFERSRNCVVLGNSVIDTNLVGHYEGDRNKYGLRNWDNSSNCLVRKNNVIVHGSYDIYGIMIRWSEVDSNDVYAYSWDCGYTRGIRADNSQIRNNKVTARDDNYRCNGSFVIESYGNSANYSTIENNKIYAKQNIRGFWGNYSKVQNNNFYGYVENTNNGEWAIGGGPGLIVRNNTFDRFEYGFYADNAQDCELSNNNFVIHGNTGFDIRKGNNTIIKNNVIRMDGNNSYGIICRSGNGSNIYKNTIVSTDSTFSGTGIRAEDNSHPIINSNLVYGFSTGIDANSAIYNIKFNLISNYDSKMIGDGLPAQAGDVVTVNNNADPSDIYSNIFLDPKFEDPVNGVFRTTLKPSSPAINAGDIDSTDLDGTIVDIGAGFYNFGYAPKDFAVDSSGNGFLAFSWDIINSDTLQGFIPVYKLSTDKDWTELPSTNEKHIVINNLTNNVIYDLSARAVYPNSKSFIPKGIKGKPGNAKISVSPDYLILSLTPSENVVKNITISNSGERDLSFNITANSDHNFSITNGTLGSAQIKNISDTIGVSGSGIKFSDIVINSDDYKNPHDTIHTLLISGNYYSLPSNHFQPVDTTLRVFYVVVDSGSIDNESLQTGDEVGIYSSSKCIGAGAFIGSFPFVIKCFGSSGVDDGFFDGDSISFKMFDYGTNRYAQSSAKLIYGELKAFNNRFTRISLSGTIYKKINIPIDKLKFNMIAIPILPRNNNIQSIFGNISGLKILYSDDGKAFIPDYNLNSIGTYDITRGYHLFTTDSVGSFQVEGLEIVPQDYPISLYANRFNSIAYLYENPMNIEYSFSSISDQISIVQDDNGLVWLPSLSLNTIGNLQPYKGYQIFTTANSEIDFSYPKYSAPKQNSNILSKPDFNTEHFTYNKSGIGYCIVIQNYDELNGLFNDGDEIGVFCRGKCVGGIKINGIVPKYIMAWKSNPDFNLLGYTSGQPIILKYFNSVNNSEQLLDFKGINNKDLLFEGKTFSILTLNLKGTEIPKEFKLLPNYPNPFNPFTVISYNIPKISNVTIKVYNALGQEVKTIVNNQRTKPGYYKIEWAGDDNFNKPVSSGVYFIRFKSMDYNSTIKALLLK